MRRALAALLLLPLLAACGDSPPSPTPVVLVITATPLPATPIPTITNPPTPTAPPAPTHTPVPPTPPPIPPTATAVPATATPVPTATPEPTATTAPRMGIAVPVADWAITVRKVRSRDRLVYNSFGAAYIPSGKFWVISVDARNTTNSSRSWRDTLDAGVLDDHQAGYDEIWTTGTDETQTNMAHFAILEGATALYAAITPRGIGHFVLAFDVAADALPTRLGLRPKGGDDTQWVLINLK
jgi:hypothetical protein